MSSIPFYIDELSQELNSYELKKFRIQLELSILPLLPLLKRLRHQKNGLILVFQQKMPASS